MNELKLRLQEQKLAVLLPAGLALGLFARWLFAGRPVGISWVIFVLALLATLLWSARRTGVKVLRRNL